MDVVLQDTLHQIFSSLPLRQLLSSPSCLHVFDPNDNQWLRFTLDFLHFAPPTPWPPPSATTSTANCPTCLSPPSHSSSTTL
ncbi:hypothetical protein GBA52_020169 [Prunus armeniaca]|nr:hypothetical protein GBA52_020169 [Prunus armeniaca]